MAKTITITLKVITPLFTGGVMQKDGPVPELRAQTIKGLLRFWYRVLHPPEPWQEEFRIFGSTGEQGGQSVFRLSIEESPPFEQADLKPKAQPWPAASAYLGYGPVDAIPNKTNQVTVKRPWIPEGTEIKLKLRFGPRTKDGDIDAVMQALWALCTFGGIGARSRHGWGSVQLIGADGHEYAHLLQSFKTKEEFSKHIQGNLGSLKPFPKYHPSYTAVSERMQLLLSPEINDTSLGALATAGDRMQRWRTARNQSSGDHELIMDYLEGKYKDKDEPLPRHPEGIAFGLPHNFYFKKQNPPNKANVNATGRINRRSSPLFLNVKLIGDSTNVALHSFLSATFLPLHEKIQLSVPGDKSRNKSVDFIGSHTAFQVIVAYLDDLKVGPAEQAWTPILV